MINLTDIARTLGEDSYDLTVLSKSSNINKWSFRKPVNMNKWSPLTDADFASVNSGFNLYTYFTPQALLYEAQNPLLSTLWDYSERQAPFRLGDFREYNHNADPMFTLEWVSDSYGTAGSTLRFSCSEDLYEFVMRWGYFSGVRSYLDFVLLIYEVGTQYSQSGVNGVGIYKITSMVDFDNNLKLKIPSSLSTGLYEMRLCFTTSTTGWDYGEYQWYNPNSGSGILPGNWYALPAHSYLQFSVGSSGGGQQGDDFFGYINWSFSNLNYEFYDPDLWNLSFTNVISVSDSPGGDDEVEMTVHTVYSYENCVDGTVSLGEDSAVLSQAGTAWKTVNISHPANIETLFTANLDNGEITINISADITIGTKTQTRNWTQRLTM